MRSSNRRWQRHLRSKGIIGFFLDRLQAHALSSEWQHENGAFYFPFDDRDVDDELSRAYFEFTERFPYDINIELTNHCNLRCKMCAREKMTRPLGVMKEALFRKIIDEIAEKQPFAYIHYYGIGEPFLDSRLFDRLAYARGKGLQNSVVFTNGQLLLHNDNYKKLAEAGVSIIGVDLDGMQAKTYEQIRIRGNFETAREGIQRLSEYIKVRPHIRTRLEIAFHVYKGINDMDAEPFATWCEANEYEYKIVTMHDWAGLRSDLPISQVEGLADAHHEARTNPCSNLWSGFAIAWDGRVPLCCLDADVNEPVGDITTQTIEDVWTGPLREKRYRQIDGVIDGLCVNCTSYSAVGMPPFDSRLYPRGHIEDEESCGNF